MGNGPSQFVSMINNFFVRLTLQVDVVHALMLREMMTRFGRHSFGFFWVMGEPLILSLCVMSAWLVGGHKLAGDVAIVPFVLSGYTLLTMWRHTVFRSIYCFRQNSGLLFHRNVHYVDSLIARELLEIGGAGIAFWVAYTPFYLLGIMDPIYNSGQVVSAWLLLGWFGFSVGILIAGLTEMSELVEKFVQPFMYVSLPLTGMFFMVSWLPDRMAKVVLYSPVANCFEMFRGGLLGHNVTAKWDAAYTVKCCLVTTAIGLYVVRKARHHIRID